MQFMHVTRNESQPTSLAQQLLECIGQTAVASTQQVQLKCTRTVQQPPCLALTFQESFRWYLVASGVVCFMDTTTTNERTIVDADCMFA